MYVLENLVLVDKSSKFQILRAGSSNNKDRIRPAGDVIDLGPVASARSLGSGQPLYLLVKFHSDLEANRRELEVSIVQSNSANLSGANVVLTLEPLDRLELNEVPYHVVPFPLYPQGKPYKRYIGLQLKNLGDRDFQSAHRIYLTAFISDTPHGNEHTFTKGYKY